MGTLILGQLFDEPVQLSALRSREPARVQELQRATTVGEATRGGAHTVRPERIDERFEMNLPYAEAVNPITHGNWEGSGVIPEVPVPAADALSAALRLARQR